MLGVPLRRTVTLLAALTVLTLVGCTSPYSGELLLADAPDPAGAAGDIAIYAVSPGDKADDSTLVASKALSPLDIRTEVDDGQVWVNSLGRVWDGSVLLAYGDGQSNIVTSGAPGDDPVDLARSAQARATVLRRGAYVQTAEGCILASSSDAIREVGTGNCSISSDERWVASWPVDGTGLTIRDLRHDSTETIDDLQIGNAAALSADHRIMAIARVADGYQGVVIDAATGEEVGRTDPYAYLDVTAIGAGATGFVLQTGTADGTALIYVDTDAEVTPIDSGFYLVPIINGAEVTYLKYGEDLTKSSLRRWTPGQKGSERMLSGYVGAASPDGVHVLASKETAAGTEFWREEGGSGAMTNVFTLERAPADADPSAGSGSGASVPQVQVQGSMVYLQVDGATTSSFVRIDMVGNHSDAPVTGVAGLLFESLDVDGTALLTRPGDSSGAAAAPDGAAATNDVLAVRRDDHEADLRATVGRTATNLIHEGTIYLTGTSDPARVTVSSLRSTGKHDTPEELYVNKQIAGATWPQWGGATRTPFITPRLLLEQAQQQAQQQAAASGGTGAGAGAAGGGAGAQPTP